MDFETARGLLKKMEILTEDPPFEHPNFRVEQARYVQYGDAVGVIKAMYKRAKLGAYTPAPQPPKPPVAEQNAEKMTEKVAEEQEKTEAAYQEPVRQHLPQRPLEFKKESSQYDEEVVEIRPLLGIDVPSLDDAEKLALQRAESLKHLPSSKEELSKRLIDLTSALLREKDPQARVGIKAEINHIKELLKGRPTTLEEQLRKMFAEDINSAVNVIKSALKVYEGLEDRSKIEEELRKAVLTYESYLERLHSKLLEELQLDIPLPSYAELKALLPKKSGEPSEAQELPEAQPTKVEEPSVEPPEREELVLEGPELSIPEVEQPSSEELHELGVSEASAIEQTSEQPAEQPAESQKSGIASDGNSDVIDEINSMREGQLLHELGARDRKAFFSYLRGELSKEEALKKARVLLAVEKGVPKEKAEEVFS